MSISSVGGVKGKAVEAVKQLVDKTAKPVSKTSFDKVLSQLENTKMVSDPNKLNSTPNLKEGLSGLLNHITKDTTQLDHMIEKMAKGQTFNPQELLQLQAFTYKVTLSTDLVSKTAESASQALKTTLQTQV